MLTKQKERGLINVENEWGGWNEMKCGPFHVCLVIKASRSWLIAMRDTVAGLGSGEKDVKSRVEIGCLERSIAKDTAVPNDRTPFVSGSPSNLIALSSSSIMQWMPHTSKGVLPCWLVQKKKAIKWVRK